jgi:hypothetical protein
MKYTKCRFGRIKLRAFCSNRDLSTHPLRTGRNNNYHNITHFDFLLTSMIISFVSQELKETERQTTVLNNTSLQSQNLLQLVLRRRINGPIPLFPICFS